MKREQQPGIPHPYVHWDTLSAYLSYSNTDEVPEIFDMYQTQYKRERNKRRDNSRGSGTNGKK